MLQISLDNLCLGSGGNICVYYNVTVLGFQPHVELAIATTNGERVSVFY